jgi:hypothetical protein
MQHSPFPRTARPRRRTVMATLLMTATATLGVAGAGLAGAQPVTPPTWHQVAVPGPTSAGFHGVSCTGTADCVAVGGEVLSSTQKAVADTEDAGSWHADTVPQPAGSHDNSFAAVSCASGGDCVAVGDRGTVEHPSPLSEVLRAGRWSILDTAPLAGVTGAELNGVSCSTATACVAVGQFFTSGGGQGTLAELYNGKTWTLDKTPGLPGSSFLAVSCLADTSPYLCTAVGQVSSGRRAIPLVELLNNDAGNWQRVTVPTVSSATISNLDGVSCPQPRSCVAVGLEIPSDGASKAIAEVEDLGHWKLTATPATPQRNAGLNGVSCPETIGSCRAVGYDGEASSRTLAETWNGIHWALQTSADPTPLSSLAAVSCVATRSRAATDACAAGGQDQADPMAASRLLVERN